MRVIIAEDRTGFRQKIKSSVTHASSEEPSGEPKEAKIDFVDISELADEMSSDGASAQLLILDIAGDGEDARAALSRWRQTHPDVPVLMLADGLTHLGEGKVGRMADAVLPRNGDSKGLGAVISRVLQKSDTTDDFKAAPLTRRDAGKALEPLTRREREVLGLLTQGFSNRDIADALGLREITVKVHLKSVYRKLGVKSRTQAVRIAMDVANGKRSRKPKA